MTCEAWVGPAVDRLDAIVEQGIHAVGAQLWVSHEGRVACDVALGDSAGGLMAPGTAHNNYCMAKPVMAMVVAGLVEAGTLDPTADLATLGLPGWSVPPFPCTVIDVLDHRAGLDGLPAMEWRMAPLPARAALVAERIAAARPRPAYSELLGGVILEEVVRAVTGCASVADEVHGRVLGPLGLDTVAFDGQRARALAAGGDVSTPVAGLPTRRVPLLFELLDRAFDELRPAFGVLCSARDMGRFLEEVRRSLVPGYRGPLAGEVATWLLSPRHAAFDDARVMRSVSVAGGFMVDAVANSFTRLASPRSFGHNGGMAQSVAFADADHDLTVSLYLNGAETGRSSALLDRLAVVDEVYRGLGVR